MSLLDAGLVVMDKLLSECFSNLSESEVVVTSSLCCLLFLLFAFFVSFLVAKQASDKSIFRSSSMPTIIQGQLWVHNDSSAGRFPSDF